MLDKKYNIKLDLQFRCNNQTMKFNQFDNNTSDFFIKINNGGKSFNINKAIVVLVAIKPSGKIVSQFLKADNDLIYSDLKSNMVDEVGIYTAQAMLILENERVVTDTISYEVDESNIISAFIEDIETQEDYSLLTDMLSRLSAIELNENTRVSNEFDRLELQSNLEELLREVEEAEVDRKEHEVLREKTYLKMKDVLEESKDVVSNVIATNNISSELINSMNLTHEKVLRTHQEVMSVKDRVEILENEVSQNEEVRQKFFGNTKITIQQVEKSEDSRRLNENTRIANEEARQLKIGNYETRYEKLITDTGKLKDDFEIFNTQANSNEAVRVEAETQRENRYTTFENDYNNIKNSINRQLQETNNVKTQLVGEVTSAKNTMTNTVDTEISKQTLKVDNKISEINTIKNQMVSNVTNATNEANRIIGIAQGVIDETNEAREDIIQDSQSSIKSITENANLSISNIKNSADKVISDVNSVKNNMVSSINNTLLAKVNEVNKAKSDMTNTISDKVKDIENRFNNLTSKQQQDSEVIDARDGEISLKKRLDRDIEKAKQIYVDVNGSYISSESSDGYLKNVKVIGNTIQDTNNLADIRSVGDKVEGQELYKIPVVSCGKNILSEIWRDGRNGSVDTYCGFKLQLDVNKSYTVSIKYKRTIPNTEDVLGAISPLVNPNSVKSKFPNKIYQTIFSRSVLHHSMTFSSNCMQDDGTCYLTIYPGNNATDFGLYNSFIEGFIEYIQIEEGTVATSYEPYQEQKLEILSPVQLEKVGNVADRIVCKDGVWGVEKNVIDKLFNGSENWVLSGWAPQENTIAFKLQNTSNTNLGICDKFILNRNNSTIDTEAFNVDSVWNEISVRINKSKLSTQDVTGFKKWLSDNTVLIMYSDNTSTFTPLPHDQQVKLRTFAGQTNIAFLTEIPGQIKAQVPKSLGATVNTHTEQIKDLHNSLDRVKKLEETTVSTIETVSNFTTVDATSNGYFEDVKLEGKTLVNLGINKSWGYGSNTAWQNVGKAFKKVPFKPSTIYTLALFNLPTNFNNALPYKLSNDYIDSNIGTFRTREDISDGDCLYLYFKDINISQEMLDKIKFVILEGDHTNNPPEYFEGLMSVGQDVEEVSVESVQNMLDYTKLANGATNGTTGVFSPSHNRLSLNVNDRINLHSQHIAIKCDNIFVSILGFAEKDGTPVYDSGYLTSNAINEVSLPSNIKYISVNIKNRYDSSISKEDAKSLYIYYQSNKKPLLYYNPTTETWEKPILREWDTIEKHSDGKYYYHKRSGEVVLNGNESLTKWSMDNTSNTFGAYLNVGAYVSTNNVIAEGFCDKMLFYSRDVLYKGLNSGVAIDINGRLCITLNKNSFTEYTVDTIKQWLQTNPVTVVYQLAQEEVYECTSIDLMTYSGETNYIINSGAISPKSLLKVHNNISNVVKILQEKVSLLESNVKTSQEIQDMMILESDMRILDMELALMEHMPIKLNLGENSMLRSLTYFNFLKNHIINETYSKDYLESVMSKYLVTNRLTKDEYDELYKMLYPQNYNIELPIEY